MKSAVGIMIRMSIMGLAGRFGTAVLPTCSIEMKGIPASVRSPVSSALMKEKWDGQSGS